VRNQGERDVGNQEAATYFTLAKVTQKYLIAIGILIGTVLALVILFVAGFFVVLKVVTDADTQQTRMCQGFEDVAEKALTPYKQVADPTPEMQKQSDFVNAQKRKRVAALAPELLAHAGCRVSVNG
jgi:hypothetical protein